MDAKTIVADLVDVHVEYYPHSKIASKLLKRIEAEQLHAALQLQEMNENPELDDAFSFDCVEMF